MKYLIHKLFHSKFYLDLKDKMDQCEYCGEEFWKQRDKIINPNDPRNEHPDY